MNITMAIVAFLGGVLTILSPCVLPVLPFVFVRTGQPFVRSTLPLLIGMAVTFALVATLAAVGGGWAVRVNSIGRGIALILLTLCGVALLSTRVASWLTRPLVAMGSRLAESNDGGSPGQSLVLGAATGFLWAPCAGPILGLILTGAALNGPSTGTTLLLFAYALGAVVSLAVAVFAGGRVFAALKKSFGAGEWLRRGLGAAVLVAVVAIVLGWDTGVLTRLSTASTTRFEQALMDRLQPANDAGQGSMAMSGAMTGAMTGSMQGGAMMSAGGAAGGAAEGELPSLDGATKWLNSPPLTPEGLRGKVVLIDFWTYSCINCLRALPHVVDWYQRYRDQGLVVIGVHTPEFAFEKNEGNVRRAVRDLGITYPVAMDNDYSIWKTFNNQYWPAHYFVDAAGKIRGHHFGEGDYRESEQLIRDLLTEAGASSLPRMSDAKGEGVQAAADDENLASPETYVGYARTLGFVSPEPVSRDRSGMYTLPETLRLNQWGLEGTWTIAAEEATLEQPGGKISFRFHARDLHLVLGPGSDGKPVRFKVLIDGQAPGENHGFDIDAQGQGIVREQRLYQLIRESGTVRDHTFTIEFLDAGVEAYSFTFG